MPGVQNPHCSAPVAANADARRSRSSSSSPSSVTTCVPSILVRGTLQLTIALPSTSTVQQPHWPDGEQPSLGERTTSSSRSAASRCGCSPETVVSTPFSEKVVMAQAFMPIQQNVNHQGLPSCELGP